MKYMNVVRRFGHSTIGKVAAGATAMIATGSAFASGGGPAEAIIAEITAGKSSVNGILVVLAGVLGLLLLWALIKRSAK